MKLLSEIFNIGFVGYATLVLFLLGAGLTLLCCKRNKRPDRSSTLALLALWAIFIAVLRTDMMTNTFLNLLRGIVGFVAMYAMFVIYQCMSFDAHQVTPGYCVNRFAGAGETLSATACVARGNVGRVTRMANVGQRLLQ